MSNDFEKRVTSKKDEDDSRYELNQLEFKDKFNFSGSKKYDF